MSVLMVTHSSLSFLANRNCVSYCSAVSEPPSTTAIRRSADSATARSMRSM